MSLRLIMFWPLSPRETGVVWASEERVIIYMNRKMVLLVVPIMS